MSARLSSSCSLPLVSYSFSLYTHSLSFFFEREKKWFIPRYFRAMSSKPLYSLVTKVGCSVPEMGPLLSPSLTHLHRKKKKLRTNLDKLCKERNKLRLEHSAVLVCVHGPPYLLSFISLRFFSLSHNDVTVEHTLIQ